VIVYIPTGVVVAVMILIVELKVGLPLLGLKEAVAPEGSPVAVKETG